MLGRALKVLLLTTRWIQAAMYGGLAVLLVAVAAKFFQELVHSFLVLMEISERQVVLFALASIDLVLIGNLLVMVIVWGYRKFVSAAEVETRGHPLGWLTKLADETLRVEIAMSLVSISAIRLLEAFLDIDEVRNDKLLWLVLIQLTFAAIAIVLSWLEKAGHGRPQR